MIAQDIKLPKCILVDIDGTIADKNTRHPHDLTRVIEDTPKWAIVDLVKRLSHDFTIIFVTGRDEVCRDQTEHWLEIMFNQTFIDGFNGLGDIHLFMRKRKDQRKDAFVKRELFEENILGKFYVEFVIDDRNQVVDMWRKELNLTCLQVDYGDF